MTDDKKVTWIELFFDLVFVAAAHQVALLLKEYYDFPSIFLNLFIFVMLLWMWFSHTMYTSRFGEKSKMYGLYTIVTLAGTLAIVIFSGQPFDEFVLLISSIYALLRVLLGIMYGLSAIMRPGRAIHLFPLIITILASAVLWLISGFTPFPLIIWGIAFAIDIATPLIGRGLLDRVAVHATHLPERLGLLTVVMLGEMVISLVASLYDHLLTFEHLVLISSGVATIAIIFLVYFHYVDRQIIDSERVFSLMYTYAHLPLYVSLVIIASGVKGITVMQPLQLLLASGVLLFAIALRLIKFVGEVRFQRRQVIAFIFLTAISIVYLFASTPLILTTSVYLLVFIVYLLIAESIGFVSIVKSNKIIWS